MTTAGIAYIELRAKLDQYERDLRNLDSTTKRAAGGVERSWRTSMGRVAGGMKSFGNRATLGLTVPLVLAGRTALRAAEEAALGQAQMEAAIRSTSNAANVSAEEQLGLAEAIAEVTLHEDDAALAGMNMLRTFTNIRNEAGEGNAIFSQAAKTLADYSAVMGVDMSSAAIQLGKALNMPTKGVTALSRAGVQFTEQQTTQIEKLVEQNDIMGAQKIILAELETQFGGVAEAQAKTDAGKQAQAMKQLNETLEDLGTTLGPVMADLAESVIPLLRGFSRLSPAVKTAIIALGLGIGPVARLTGGILSLTSALKVARTATAATTVAQTAATASSVGMATSLGGLAAAAAPVAGVLAVGAGAYVGLKKVTDEYIKTQDLHRESMNDSHSLMMAYFKNVEAGHHTIADFRQMVLNLATAEGVSAREGAELLANARQLSEAFARGRTQAQGYAYSVNALESALRSLPSNTPVRVTYEQLGNPVAAPGTIRARAVGGPVSANRSYLVGERGPEIVTMGSRGHVTPNDKLGGATFNFYAPVYGYDDFSQKVRQVYGADVHLGKRVARTKANRG